MAVSQTDTPGQVLAVVILAAGEGRRMQQTRPKVLTPLAGRALVSWVYLAVRAAFPQADCAVVVGKYGREIQEELTAQNRAEWPLPTFITQSQPRGTGHALQVAMDAPWGRTRRGCVLVLPGDVPLVGDRTLRRLGRRLPVATRGRVLTTILARPRGYGRIVRVGTQVRRIIEERDANATEKKICEVNTSIYLFQAPALRKVLRQLRDSNAQKELYLGDCIQHWSQAGQRIEAMVGRNATSLRGINDLWQWHQLARRANARVLRHWARQGVEIQDGTVRIDAQVQLSSGTRLGAGTQLQGSTRLGARCQIEPGVLLKDVVLEDDCHVLAGSVLDGTQAASGCRIGPYAHLRAGVSLGRDVRVGNFVELKAVNVGHHSRIAHLSYLGDAQVGQRVNIGCGFVSCNYDIRSGEPRKERTVIEDDVFMGSSCQAIAPIRIGKGAYIASGSTLTQDVEAGAFALARARQVNKPGYARKYSRR